MKEAFLQVLLHSASTLLTDKNTSFGLHKYDFLPLYLHVSRALSQQSIISIIDLISVA